jgi:hypothetical protein
VRTITLSLLALSVLTASRGHAREIFVDNIAGDDRLQGLEPNTVGPDGPLRSITRALQLAQPRDRIVLANTGVPYRESVSLVGGDHSGVPHEWFILDGNGATLDGTAPVPPLAWSPAGVKDVFRFQPPRMAHQQLYLAGRPLARVALPQGAESLPALAPLQWCLWRGHVYFRIEEGKWIDDYPLFHTLLPVGITLYHVRHAAVTNLIVQGFQLDGINAHDVADCTLDAITARGNGRSGIASTASSRLTVNSCLVGDNGEAQLLAEGYSKTTVQSSSLLENTAPAIVRRGGDVTVAEPVEQAAPPANTEPPVNEPPAANGPTTDAAPPESR